MSTETDETAIAVRSTWFVRAIRATPVIRRLIPIEAPTEFKAGSDYVSSVTPEPAYPARGAMSAYGAFPWVVSCCAALSVDISSIPLFVKDSSGKRLSSHPLLDLLSQPSERTSGVSFFHQWVTDFSLVGWAPRLIMNDGAGNPLSLVRMHPARVTIQATPRGEADAYLYNELGTRTAYSYQAVLNPRSPSFEDGPNSAYGQGAIRALHRDLNADLSAQQLAQRSAKTGRPSAVATPAKGSGVERWNTKQVKALSEQLGKLARDKHGGIAVLNGMVDITPIGWSPRDMEFGGGRKLTRETVLASFHVPPSRVGLPTANFATQRQQMATYWEHLKGISRVFASELNRLGRRYPVPVTVEFDFSGIEALQTGRTERLQRVSTHIMNGVPPAEAYRAEGFETLAETVSALPVMDNETEIRAVIDRLLNGAVSEHEARQLAEALSGKWTRAA